MHIVIDIVNVLLYKYIYFYANMCKNTVPRSREVGRLLSNCLSNMRLKHKIG